MRKYIKSSKNIYVCSFNFHVLASFNVMSSFFFFFLSFSLDKLQPDHFNFEYLFFVVYFTFLFRISKTADVNLGEEWY